MQVLVNTDERISCDDELILRVEGFLQETLERFGAYIIQIEVQLRDLDSPSPGDRDKCCRLEARVSGMVMVAAEHEALTLTEAIHAAADKLKRSLIQHMRHVETHAAGPAGAKS